MKLPEVSVHTNYNKEIVISSRGAKSGDFRTRFFALWEFFLLPLDFFSPEGFARGRKKMLGSKKCSPTEKKKRSKRTPLFSAEGQKTIYFLVVQKRVQYYKFLKYFKIQQQK